MTDTPPPTNTPSRSSGNGLMWLLGVVLALVAIAGAGLIVYSVLPRDTAVSAGTPAATAPALDSTAAPAGGTAAAQGPTQTLAATQPGAATSAPVAQATSASQMTAAPTDTLAPETATAAAQATLVATRSGTSLPSPTATSTGRPSITPAGPVTATPTGTPGPTATATSVLPDGWTFDHIRLQPDITLKSLVIYGEVFNNTGKAQAIKAIKGDFRDSAGNLIADQSAVKGVWPSAIAPQGSWMPFTLTVSGITDTANYSLNVQADPSTDVVRQDWQFQDVTDFTQQDHYYCVSAQVNNTGLDLVRYFDISMVLFDNTGAVISVSDAYHPALADFPPGLPLNFQLCADQLGQTVDHYELQGWGQ